MEIMLFCASISKFVGKEKLDITLVLISKTGNGFYNS